MAEGTVCVVGSAIRDLMCYTHVLPKVGQTIKGTSFSVGFGGKGANQAVQAAMLGAHVNMVAKLGDDAYGKEYMSHFQKLGMACQHVGERQGVATGVALIMVDAAGNNSIVIIPGANDCLLPADVDKARDTIQACRVCVCQLEVPVETTHRALEVAKAGGAATILNPAPAAHIPDVLYALTDVLCPNETEAEVLTGVHVTDDDSARRAVMKLVEKGCKQVVLTLGSRGCLVYDGTSFTHVAAPTVTAIDTTGAGDSFIGCLATALSYGSSLVEAVTLAVHVASQSVTRTGTQSSYAALDALPPCLTETSDAGNLRLRKAMQQ